MPGHRQKCSKQEFTVKIEQEICGRPLEMISDCRQVILALLNAFLSFKAADFNLDLQKFVESL